MGGLRVEGHCGKLIVFVMFRKYDGAMPKAVITIAQKIIARIGRVCFSNLNSIGS